MSKFLKGEKAIVKSIVANLTIKRIPDLEIIQNIFEVTNKTITLRYLSKLRQQIKRESFKWYKTMRDGEYEYIHEFKERMNEILFLQKKHYEIVDSPTIPIPIKQASLAELHRLTITLSNLYDVAPTNSRSRKRCFPINYTKN